MAKIKTTRVVKRPAQVVHVIIAGARYQPSCRVCKWVGRFRTSVGGAQRECAEHRRIKGCPMYRGHRRWLLPS